jgi:UDP-N-acetylmuramyl tripeptide synthase
MFLLLYETIVILSKFITFVAQKGDVILVAGKGHENYQEIKGVKHHFDDKEVLKDIFDNE